MSMKRKLEKNDRSYKNNLSKKTVKPLSDSDSDDASDGNGSVSSNSSENHGEVVQSKKKARLQSTHENTKEVRRKKVKHASDDSDSDDKEVSAMDEQDGKEVESDSDSSESDNNNYEDDDTKTEKKVEKKVYPKVPQAVQQCVYVGGLSFDARENDVRDYFSECGEISMIRLPQYERPPHRYKGYAFVEFNTKEAADAAIAMNGKEMMGRWLQIYLTKDGGATRDNGYTRTQEALSEKPANCTNIFVGNLSWSCRDVDLQTAFADCGTIADIRIAMDAHTQRSQGFAYVEFEDEASVDKAIQKAGDLVCGRPVRIDYAESGSGANGVTSKPKYNRGENVKPTYFGTGDGGDTFNRQIQTKPYRPSHRRGGTSSRVAYASRGRGRGRGRH